MKREDHVLNLIAKRNQLQLDIKNAIMVDLFAGGGGLSEAAELAFGTHMDYAANHDDDAISMHAANHPQTVHLKADVREICPREIAQGRTVGLLHLSPDCTNFSQAKAGQPRDKRIRSLSWVALSWAGQVHPISLTLENVTEILTWNRLVAKRDPATGRVVKVDGSVAAKGERVPVREQFLVPDSKNSGKTWRRFVTILRSMGYAVEWRTLVAADYGAPTTRQRLFMVARRDGKPIVWPEPTHFKDPKPGQRRWRAASECIDWSLPAPSIFNRARPLANATQERIAKGIMRYVVQSSDPFIVPADALEQRESGSRSIQAAYLAQMNGGFNKTPGRDLRMPMTTITSSGSQQELVTAHLIHLRGNCDARNLRDPLMTISAGGQHHGVVECRLSQSDKKAALKVADFLLSYPEAVGFSKHGRMSVKDRLALVTVTVAGCQYLIVDVGLRMLEPHELYAAQGFPKSYKLSHGHAGQAFTKRAQVRMCGNSVSPPPAVALLRANFPELIVHDRLRQAA